MPTKNRADIISDAIMSVIMQSYQNWELIIVSDGGSDDTPHVVEEFSDPRIRFIELKESLGNAAARNVGLKAGKGSLISYLDDDDLWDPDFLLISVNVLQEKKAEFVYSAQAVWRGFQSMVRLGEYFSGIRFSPFNRSLLENKNYISMISCVHTKELGENTGYFDESLKRLVDWDFFLRATDLTVPSAISCVLSHCFTGRVSNNVTSSCSNEEAFREIRERQLARACWRMPFQKLHVMHGLSAGSMRGGHISRQRAEQTVCIIIPNYESFNELSLTVESITENTECCYRVTVVDNGSSSQCRSRLTKLIRKFPQMELISYDKQRGFTYAVNAGISHVLNTRSHTLILNNDVVVTPGWLSELLRVLDEHEDVGMAVPRQVLLPGHDISKIHVPWSRPEYEVDINLSAHHKNVIDPCFDERKGFIELSYAPLFCALIHKDMLRYLGHLDAGNGNHFRSDWIYCNSMRKWANRRIVYTPFSKVYHLQGVATAALQTEMTRQLRLA